eukprot:scaffold55038_cov38-Tisochrysis_lutea.AAC.1
MILSGGGTGLRPGVSYMRFLRGGVGWGGGFLFLAESTVECAAHPHPFRLIAGGGRTTGFDDSTRLSQSCKQDRMVTTTI